ncbi:MAG: hypothetical protein WCI71_11010, partial [Bacteroidota bacterium]
MFLNHIQKTLNVELVGLPGNIPNLEEYQDKEFGAAFEVFLFMAERLFHLKDYREVFLFRHLVNFIFFWIGVLVFSAVIRDRYRDWFFPLIGSLMLFLHPRIFAESFYNSKDIILMVFFTFSMWSYIRVLKTGRLSYILLLAFISAITFNIRPIGILIPCLAFIILPTHFIIAPESPAGRNRILKNLIALPLFFLIFSWITNPYLWIDPIGRAGAILVKFLNYDVSHTAGHLLFLGKFIPTSQIPWFYLPLWIGITTPIVYLVLSISGLLVTITKAFRNKSPVPGLPHHSLDVYVAGWLIVPAFTAILFGSTLYDGWRHFYFLWPAIVYFAISGLQSIIAVLVKVRGTRNTQAGKWIVLLLAAIVLSENLYTMIRYHPHQYCYFNEIAPDPSKNFELDYWGLSYHDALEHLVTTCPSDTLSIRVLNLPGYLNAFLLKPADRKRVWFDYS